MPIIKKNDITYSGETSERSLTKTEYDSLSPQEKNNGTTYYVSDVNEDDYKLLAEDIEMNNGNTVEYEINQINNNIMPMIDSGILHGEEDNVIYVNKTDLPIGLYFGIIYETNYGTSSNFVIFSVTSNFINPILGCEQVDGTKIKINTNGWYSYARVFRLIQ